MGRKKLEMKLIESKSARQVTFSKRKNGLLKKAKELSILCDAHVGAIVCSSSGRIFNYCSNNSLDSTIKQYRSYVASESCTAAGGCKEQAYSTKYSEYITREELLQLVERELGDTVDEQRSVIDLVLLENQLQDALMQTRKAKTCLLVNSVSDLIDKESILEKEKNLREDEIEILKKKTAATLDLNFAPCCCDTNE